MYAAKTVLISKLGGRILKYEICLGIITGVDISLTRCAQAPCRHKKGGRLTGQCDSSKHANVSKPP